MGEQEEFRGPLLANQPQPSSRPQDATHVPITDCAHATTLRVSHPRIDLSIGCMLYHSLLILLITLLFLVATGLALWPSRPELHIVSLQLDHFNISQSMDPIAPFNASLALTIKILNKDFVSRYYNRVSVSIKYEGKWLGSATSNGTFVDARSVSYIGMHVHVCGNWAPEAVPDQHNNIIEGSIPFEIVVEVGARFHLFTYNVPFEVCVLFLEILLHEESIIKCSEI